MRWARALKVAALALVVLTMIGLAAIAVGSVLPSFYGSSMPGIEEVRVSRSREDTLAFRVVFDGPIDPTRATLLQVDLGTDRDRSTGENGFEYALDFSAPNREEDPYASVLNSGDETTSEIDVPSLQFTLGPSSMTFAVAAKDVGDPSVFDFYVFVEDDGVLIDDAPGHVLVSQPWTYPSNGVSSADDLPSEVYVDSQDFGLNVLASRALSNPVPTSGIVLACVALAGIIAAAALVRRRRRSAGTTSSGAIDP